MASIILLINLKKTKMKQTILMLTVVAAMMSSCADNGKKAETKDAEKVEVSKNESTVVYNKVGSASFLDWRASHLGGVQPRYGKVYLKTVNVLVNNDMISNASIEIDMATFTVESFEDEDSKNKLTGHLQSDDFFQISTYPVSLFELTNIKASEGDYNAIVTGNLTILDVTKSITFNANIAVSADEVSIKSEDFVVNRTDWGLVYNTEGTEGVPVDYLISNDIGFTIDVVASK
jgi:polyisoprenoid-binding protein YceI